METTVATRAPSIRFSQSPLEALRTRWTQYRTYRQTVRELNALTNRDLADLGINRAMIGRLAHEAAWGAK